MKVVEKLKIKVRRLAYRLKHDFFNFEGAVVVVALVFCFSFVWGAISSTSRNWELAQRLEQRRRELTLLQLEVENLEIENQYLASEEYQELAARRQQGKLLRGEKLVYLPENSDAAKSKHPTTQKTIEPKDSTNFEQWLSFVFGV